MAKHEAPDLYANFGHGHVFPREDGARMRCGGSGLCPSCSKDQAVKDHATTVDVEYIANHRVKD